MTEDEKAQKVVEGWEVDPAVGKYPDWFREDISQALTQYADEKVREWVHTECVKCSKWTDQLSKLESENERLKKENEVLKKKIKDDSWRWEQYIGTSDLKKYSELQSQLSIMREALEWAKQWIDDGLNFTDDDRPIHDCEYETDPEKGKCYFCYGYTNLEQALKKVEEGK